MVRKSKTTALHTALKAPINFICANYWWPRDLPQFSNHKAEQEICRHRLNQSLNPEDCLFCFVIWKLPEEDLLESFWCGVWTCCLRFDFWSHICNLFCGFACSTLCLTSLFTKLPETANHTVNSGLMNPTTWSNVMLWENWGQQNIVYKKVFSSLMKCHDIEISTPQPLY